MLIALAGWIFSYDGSFSFDSGAKYDDKVPIFHMRLFCALVGSFAAPFMYGICRNLRYSRSTSFVVAMMTVCDNALLTISKFVLLDPILLSFTAFAVFCATKFESVNNVPFSSSWFAWLATTGVALGLVVSVKWVGLFTYAFVGVLTIRQLWSLLPVARRFPATFVNHFVCRVLFLIVLPLGIYMSMFYIHFTILNRSGPGDAHMSSRFQYNLVDSGIKSGASKVIVGYSTVTIKNRGHGGGLLHSHPHAYPTGSEQGQVTLYHHRDENNDWLVLPAWNRSASIGMELYDGAVVRLLHKLTKRNLHSHVVAAPISTYENEVSTYGDETIGDDKDHWKVEIVNGKTKSGTSPSVTRLRTVIRLRHDVLGCYLATSGQKLPEWGYGQMEVICTTDGQSRSAQWNIEQNHVEQNTSENHANEGDTEQDEQTVHEQTVHESAFWDFVEDFVDLNVAMWYGNNALTPKPGHKDILISKPSQWPMLDVGLRMCNWEKETIKYYLLGNPAIWWTSLGCIVLFVAEAATVYIKEKMNGFVEIAEEIYVENGWILVIGWFLHYYPFSMMGRVTYLHHYFPALMLSTLLVGHRLQRMHGWTAKIVSWMLFASYVTTFVFFSPVTYGFEGDANERMIWRQWRSTWNVVDN